jgi:glutathione S-transferase
LEGVLASSSSNTPWLVGNKMTMADMVFVPWNDQLDMALKVSGDQRFKGFPHVQGWHERLTQRPAWVRAMKRRTEMMSGIQLNDLVDEAQELFTRP